MVSPAFEPIAMLRPGRKITGMSAILLPFANDGEVDWPSFRDHVARTAEAGLIPAVNMDTGYVNLIDESLRLKVLEHTHGVLAGEKFVAGAFVGDSVGNRFDLDMYCRRMAPIQERGGTPVIFQSYGLTQQSDDAIVDSYAQIGKRAESFLGFELSQVFAPFGRIYSMDVYRGLMGIKACIGAKHSSLRRDLEWERLLARDEMRPEFKVLTGNDLAIDMVMYGSDYLLGLSTFAPDLFSQRDRYWLAGDPAFYELNDILQYLGFLTFRQPVPAYKHSAAMFLKLRGWIATDDTHPQSPTRPASDREILANIAGMLNRYMTK